MERRTYRVCAANSRTSLRTPKAELRSQELQEFRMGWPPFPFCGRSFRRRILVGRSSVRAGDGAEKQNSGVRSCRSSESGEEARFHRWAIIQAKRSDRTGDEREEELGVGDTGSSEVGGAHFRFVGDHSGRSPSSRGWRGKAELRVRSCMSSEWGGRPFPFCGRSFRRRSLVGRSSVRAGDGAEKQNSGVRSCRSSEWGGRPFPFCGRSLRRRSLVGRKFPSEPGMARNPRLGQSRFRRARSSVRQSISARISVNPFVQTSQVCPPLSRNTQRAGMRPINRSIPGSRRSVSP